MRAIRKKCGVFLRGSKCRKWGGRNTTRIRGSKRSKLTCEATVAERLRDAENKIKTSILLKIPRTRAQVPVDMWITYLHEAKNLTK